MWNSLEETVELWSAGFVAAGEVGAELAPGIEGRIGGRVAILQATGSLEAIQQKPSELYEVDDRASVTAGLVEMQAGVAFELGRGVTLDLSAGVSARNDNFSIVNPRTGPGISAKDPLYSAEPAHLEQAVMFSNRVSIGLSAAF